MYEHSVQQTDAKLCDPRQDDRLTKYSVIIIVLHSRVAVDGPKGGIDIRAAADVCNVIYYMHSSILTSLVTV